MPPGAELDLRQLPNIARDRSPAGRAKLFALLAALLTSRWSSMTTGERDQLAELIVVLLPRAEPEDRRHLLADLAGRPDLPKPLQPLVMSAADLAPGSSNGSAPASQPELRSAKGKPITITLRQHKVLPRPTDAGDAAEVRSPIAPSADRLSDPTSVTVDSAVLPQSMSPEAVDDEAPPQFPAAAQSQAADDDQPALTGPRENPHRLTTGLLAEVLARGDLARFEVMLAHLTSLRTPLLRRLLRDSGNESLAILSKSLGLNAGEFRQQWQAWRQQMHLLDPYGGQPDRRESQRIGDFFAQLTDRQVDRLIERWRSDGVRLFAGREQPARQAEI